MGLLDVLNGIQNDPRGPREPGATSGGMSKMAIALIALLGYKALKSFTGTQPTPAQGSDPGVNPTGATSAHESGGGIMGGLGDLLKGPLGGILAGAKRREWRIERSAKPVPAGRSKRCGRIVGGQRAQPCHFACRFE